MCVTVNEEEKIAAFIKDNDVKGNALRKLKFNGRPARLDLVRRYCKKTGAHEDVANALPTKALEQVLTRIDERSRQHISGPTESDYNSAEATDGSDREELDETPTTPVVMMTSEQG